MIFRGATTKRVTAIVTIAVGVLLMACEATVPETAADPMDQRVEALRALFGSVRDDATDKRVNAALGWNLDRRVEHTLTPSKIVGRVPMVMASGWDDPECEIGSSATTEEIREFHACSDGADADEDCDAFTEVIWSEPDENGVRTFEGIHVHCVEY